jgi:hypothetical protein
VRDLPGVYKGQPEATQEFEDEYKLGLSFLTQLAEKVGLRVE